MAGKFSREKAQKAQRILTTNEHEFTRRGIEQEQTEVTEGGWEDEDGGWKVEDMHGKT
jgi:hypothetical protein